MLFLPIRAKNPPERFPYVTFALILTNVLIFLLSSDYFLFIRHTVIADYALTHNNLSLFRLFTSIFLHGNLLHLCGNMLFLWIFGASLEGRLRPARFLALYLIAGLLGGLLHDVVVGALSPDRYIIGASGAIMGLAGAYLYVFPYSKISIFYLLFFRPGVVEWQARWVVLYYVGWDALNAYLTPRGDGIAHLAHLGGFGAGLLGVTLLRVRRDSQDVSEIQAIHAEMKDYSLLSLNDLEVLTRKESQDLQLIMAYCDKALRSNLTHQEQSLSLLRQHIRALVEQSDPHWLAQTLLLVPSQIGGVPLIFYLRIGSRLEAYGSYELAIGIYRRIYDLDPYTPDSESALFRTALIMQNVYNNYDYARLTYIELLRLFPEGSLSLEAQRTLHQIQDR